jgi:putative flippase GtrA
MSWSRGRAAGAARPVLPTASGCFVDARLRKSVRQFVKFCFVGASGVVVNLAVFTGVLLLWMAVTGHIASAGDLSQSLVDLAIKKDTTAVPLAAAYVANAAGFIVSVFTNYYLNRRWTFRSTGAVSRELPKFFTVSVTAYVAQLVVFWALHDVAHVAPIPSQLVAIATVMPINFVFNKLWSFRGA